MFTTFKYVSIFLIAAGVTILIADKSPGAEILLLAGLFIFFITKEKIQDERAQVFKASSAYIALILGYMIKLISSNLYSHHIITVHLTNINYFLILVFFLAILIFYTRMFITQK